MKIIKYLFFLILIAIIAGAIYIATKDGNYQVEDSINIAAPTSVVYNEVNDFRNWENWGPWMDDADDLILDYGSKTSGEGGSYSWKSEDMGDGNIITTKAIPNNSIEQELNFKSTYGESTSDVYWKFEDAEDGTLVTWGIKGSQSFMEKLGFAFKDESFSNMLKPMLAEGLDKLKKVTEDKMNAYSINVDGITQHGGGFYMYTTTASKVSQVRVKMPQMFTDVSLYMKQNNITESGNPFVLYNQWDKQNNSAIYSVGIFTPSLVITPAESSILNGMLPVQKVVKTTLKGDYKYMQRAWDKAYQYISDNNLQPSEDQAVFEVYKVSAAQTQNPSLWITEIYIPLIQPEVEILN